MKRVRVLPNGACLFTSLRLGFELLGLLKAGPIEDAVFGGSDPNVLQSAQKLRAIICNFYAPDKWDLPITEGVSRKTILAAELCKKDLDVSDHDILRYLSLMKQHDTWGSQPEYVAFAYMARVNVKVWQTGPSGLFEIDSFGVFDRTIHLLFCANHYDLLVEDTDTQKFLEAYPQFASAFEPL